MRTSKLTEYEAFKKSLKLLEEDSNVQYVEFGEYVLMSKKKIEETAKRINEAQLMRLAINGKPNWCQITYINVLNVEQRITKSVQ